MLSTTKQSRITVGLLAVASVLAVSACGNRVDHDRIAALGNGYNASTSQASDGSPVAGGTTGSTGAAGPAASTATAGTTTGPAVGGTGGGSSGSTGGATRATTGAGSTSRSTTGGSATSGTTAPAVSAACTTSLKPVVLGQTLAASGLVGASVSNLRTGLAVWAKDVNARGGLECHPVQLYQLDDGSDPARVSANWNELVHNRGAVAVVGAGVPVAAGALRSAAERDKVPVVGGDVTATDWVQSPYLFPQGGAPMTANDGGLAAAGRAAGGGKAGLIYCVEASICTAMKNNFAKSARLAKLALGPAQAVSLTQSDYTSECQRMKDAGVTVLFLGLDGSASARVARSCASLGYRPTYATNAIAVSAQASQDANLRAAGLYLGSGIVPFTESTTPGSKAFHVAFDRYGGGDLDQPTALGWASGKLLEAALAKVSAKARAGDITTALVLEGLYSLKNQTLDGLSPGVTFVKGSPAKAPTCYYGMSLTAAGFRATNGSTKACL